MSTKNIYGNIITRDLFISPTEIFKDRLDHIRAEIERYLKDLTELKKLYEKDPQLLNIEELATHISYIQFFNRKKFALNKISSEIEKKLQNSFLSKRFSSFAVYSGLYCIFMLLLGLKESQDDIDFFLFIINIYTAAYLYLGIVRKECSKSESIKYFLIIFSIIFILEILFRFFKTFPHYEINKIVAWCNFVITLAFSMIHFIFYFFSTIFSLIFIQFNQKISIERDYEEITHEGANCASFVTKFKGDDLEIEYEK